MYWKVKKSGSAIDKAGFKKLQNKTCDTFRAAHWYYVNGILLEGLE